MSIEVANESGIDVSERELISVAKFVIGKMEVNPAAELSMVLLDTAAMAVLLEGLIATHGKGPEIFLVGASESVTKVFQLAGFEDALLRCFGCMDDVQQQIAS